MIVLRFSMQMKDNFSVLMASVMSLHFSIKEEDILEHINGKCHSRVGYLVHFKDEM
jgi:hypothetical protein